MSLDINKTIEQASLDNLHDIVPLEEIGFFPLAPGWFILFALLLTIIFHLSIKIYKYYKNTRYRREAKKELNIYKKVSNENSILLLSLAKRVGITAYTRKAVAHLSTNQWWDFIELNSKVKINSALRQEINLLLYDSTFIIDASLYKKLKKLIKLWIISHRVDINA